MRFVGDVDHVRLRPDAARARLHVRRAGGFVGDERVGARQAVRSLEVRHLFVFDRRHGVRSASRRVGVDQPHHLRFCHVRDVPAAGETGAAEADVEAMVVLVNHRVMRVLILVTGRAFPLARRRRAAEELRMLRVLQIPDVDHRQAAVARLTRARIEQTGLLRPPSLVRPPDERAAAPGSAVVRRRAGDLGHLEDLRWIGAARGDVPDLELELLARYPSCESGSRDPPGPS